MKLTLTLTSAALALAALLPCIASEPVPVAPTPSTPQYDGLRPLFEVDDTARSSLIDKKGFKQTSRRQVLERLKARRLNRRQTASHVPSVCGYSTGAPYTGTGTFRYGVVENANGQPASYTYTTSTATSDTLCAQQCDAIPDCQSAAKQVDDDTCYLFSSSIGDFYGPDFDIAIKDKTCAEIVADDTTAASYSCCDLYY